MGLKQVVEDAVVTALNAMGDLAINMEYHAVTVGAYDNDTDAPSVTETVFTTKCAKVKYKVDTQDWQKTDLVQTKIIASGKAFRDAGVPLPKEDDYMIVEGVRYEVRNFTAPPTDPVYIFLVQAP